MARIGLGKIAAGMAAAAAAGATWFYLREKSTETPPAETILTDGPFEIRRYPALLVAETVQAGSRDRALGNGFGLLADYIFAESREGEEIAMTAPVLATAQAAGGWRIRFFMPRSWTRDTLPPPGEGVAIGELAPREVALVRFPGRADDRLLAAKEAELRDWLARQERTPATGIAEHAFYNSPLMPGPLRSNEVWLPITNQ